LNILFRLSKASFCVKSETRYVPGETPNRRDIPKGQTDNPINRSKVLIFPVILYPSKKTLIKYPFNLSAVCAIFAHTESSISSKHENIFFRLRQYVPKWNILNPPLIQMTVARGNL